MKNKCQCGCGRFIRINQWTGKYANYIHGHNAKGIKLSKEHKNNISKSLKGRVISKEWRKKIGLAHKGRKLSE